MKFARMRGMLLVALIGGALASGSAPKEQPKAAGTQQAQATEKPPSGEQQKTSGGSQESGCPGTRAPQFSCEALTAEATLRQADIAADQTDISYWNNVFSIVTALIAGLAAGFAWRAADAAQKNLAHDKLTAAAQLRPWLCFDGFEPSFFPKGGNLDGKRYKTLLAATMKLINTGQTPALNCKMAVRFRTTAMDEFNVDWTAADFPTSPIEPQVSVVGPQRPIETSPIGIPPPFCDDIYAGRLCLWLYLRVEYEGPAHKGEPYFTEITLRATLATSETRPDGTKLASLIGIVAGPLNTMR